MNIKNTRIKRQTRIRKKIDSVSDRMRLSVFRSNRYMYAQIIDSKGDTVIGISEKVIAAKEKASPIERSKALGLAVAKKAIEKKIIEVAFDKGRFSYHGKVAALAEGAREGGLKL
jgi:large subunit ribosomal protein L18